MLVLGTHDYLHSSTDLAIDCLTYKIVARTNPQVSMAGLGVVARSTNSRSTGLRALLAKAIATTALAYVMSVALRQAAITEKLAVAAGRVEDNGVYTA